MKVIFVAGTDTGVGKTVVTGLLAQYLLKKGYRVVTQKWVETGNAGFSGDVDVHLQFMGKKRHDFPGVLSLMMPYVFRFASSPHLSAHLEKKKINISRIKKSLEVLSKDFDFVLVEGTGGLLVPLNTKSLLIDVIKELVLSVLVVAGNKLGAINHTLLSLEALRRRKIPVLGVIFNNISKNTNRIILKNNPEIVRKLSGEAILGVLPWMKEPEQLQEKFSHIARKLVKRYAVLSTK